MRIPSYALVSSIVESNPVIVKHHAPPSLPPGLLPVPVVVKQCNTIEETHTWFIDLFRCIQQCVADYPYTNYRPYINDLCMHALMARTITTHADTPIVFILQQIYRLYPEIIPTLSNEFVRAYALADTHTLCYDLPAHINLFVHVLHAAPVRAISRDTLRPLIIRTHVHLYSINASLETIVTLANAYAHCGSSSIFGISKDLARLPFFSDIPYFLRTFRAILPITHQARFITAVTLSQNSDDYAWLQQLVQHAPELIHSHIAAPFPDPRLPLYDGPV
jgi:hypothetical protein